MKTNTKPKKFNNNFNKPLPKKTNKPKVFKFKSSYKKPRSWVEITAEANAIGAHCLIVMHGLDDERNKAKVKIQKRFPELNAEIEALTGIDPYVEYYKDSQALDTQKNLFYFFGLLIVILATIFILPIAPILFFCYLIGIIISLFLKIPYSRYFNEEDSRRYQELDDPYEL